ncbi:MAG: polysaccharide deacetylase family protein [Dehalococcoidia bacterium]
MCRLTRRLGSWRPAARRLARGIAAAVTEFIPVLLLLAGCSANKPKPSAPAARVAQQTEVGTPLGTVASPSISVTAPVRGLPQYTVQSGDTLGLIAQRNHTTVSGLQQANGIAGDTIRVGQSLSIPAAPPTVTVVARQRTPPPDTSPAILATKGRTDTNAIALTFDAGADVGYARLILDTLKRNGIHATFGMTGQWAETNPDVVKQIAAEGHELMNHTWDHASFSGLSSPDVARTREQRWSELDRTEDIVVQLTGKSTVPYFRAPFGDDEKSVETDIGLRGYRYDVLWSVDTRGWAKASVAQIIATCSKGAAPGAIIVMHVGADSQDGPALQSVIDVIRQKGLGFATISQLLPSH